MSEKKPVDLEATIEEHEEFRKLSVAQRHAHYLQLRGTLETPNIVDAFSEIERGDFIPVTQYEGIFLEKPLGIGHDQTNSAPSIVSQMLEKIQPQPGEKILDVGSGSGWTTALLSHCVGDNGQVVGVERFEELVELGRENVAKYRHTTNVDIHHTPNEIGWCAEAPYDKILVSAQIHTIPPELVEQLADNGEILIPIVYTDGELIEIMKEYERTHKDVEFSQEEFDALLADNKKYPRSKAVLYRKIDGELVEIDVIPELTFVPLVVEKDTAVEEQLSLD